MKRFVIIILTFLSIGGQAQTVDTLLNGQREPIYYYWDTNWVDYKQNHGMQSNTSGGGGNRCQMARACRVIYNDGMKIIGIAGAATIGTVGPFLDSNEAHRAPEYFELYKPYGDSMALIASARWDSLPVRHHIQLIHYAGITYYPPVREAYFTKPIQMTDSFYISGTVNNAARECIGANGSPGRLLHPYTCYWRSRDVQHRSKYKHNPPYYKMRNVLLCPSEQSWMDTLWHFATNSSDNEYSFLCIFPIFDTTGMVIDPNLGGGGTGGDDSSACPVPTGLRLMEQDAEAASFTWNSGGNSAWEISFGPAGSDPDNGTLQQSSAPFATVAASDVDTGMWYDLRVRTVCNTAHSDWSDPVQFIFHSSGGQTEIGDFDDEYTLIAPNPASTKVSLFSSYYIRGYALYDLKGQLMEQRSVHATGTTIDVAAYPRGTYILRLYTAYGESTHKLVLK